MFGAYTNPIYSHQPLNRRTHVHPRSPEAGQNFRRWVDFTNRNSSRIQYLKSMYPNYLTKIKEGLYLQPEEKELQYLIHRRNKHSGDLHKGQCYLMCGDFRMYQKLSTKLYFGKYSTKTWSQVEAHDPCYIDSLCDTLQLGSQKRKMVDYIRRERKAQQQYLFKQRQKAHSQGNERTCDLSERRSRSRQRK